MTSLVQALADRAVGAVERVASSEITVLLDPDSPNATALNTGTPNALPRLNGYVLIPNEAGATVGIITEVRIERLPYPKRKGMQDFGLVDLPFPSRLVRVIPLGTLEARSKGGLLSFRVRRGIDVFPSVGDPVAIPTLQQLHAIVEGDGDPDAPRIAIGHCPTAGRAPVHVNPDKLFGRHLAVLGNTGAGKSCSVAGLVRWSIEAATRAGTEGRPNARFIILDPNGEYARAFSGLEVRLFQVSPESADNQLKVPAWLWSGTEWAAFTGAAPGVQRPLLLEAIRRLRSGAAEPDTLATRVRRVARLYSDRLDQHVRNGDHLAQGRREGVARFLLSTSEEFTGLAGDPACDADLKPLLEGVASKAAQVENDSRQPNSSQWHDTITEVRLTPLRTALDEVRSKVGLDDDSHSVGEDVPRHFPVDLLPRFVEALAAGGAGRDLAQFVDTLTLRIKSVLSRGRLGQVVQPPDSSTITLENWLSDYVGADGASNCPIAVVDLSLVPSDVVQVVVAVLARMIFEAAQRYRQEVGDELPTTLVLEEAHTFVHKDLGSDGGSPEGRACYRVFERIAREGRKFGVGLVLASQRPSELSPTVLSQCNTFLLHRIVNDQDQNLVRRLVPDALGDLLKELPTLPSRRAILLGWAAPAPVLVEMAELAEGHRPHSPDPSFWDVWTGKKARPIDWKPIAAAWTAGKEGSDGE